VVTEDDVIPLHLDIPVALEPDEGEVQYFSFTPSKTDRYMFYSSGHYDTFGRLYDSNMMQLAYNDDCVSGNFSITYQLIAGTKYYYSAEIGSDTIAGPFTVMLKTVQYTPLQLGVPLEVDIAKGETKYLSFTPSESGDYRFYSSGSMDTFGTLFDSNMRELYSDDEGGSDHNFSMPIPLEEGTQYYFGVSLYSKTDSGTITVMIEKSNEYDSSSFSYDLLDDETASITGCSVSGNVVIPDTLDGYTVSNLAAELFYGRSDIVSVTIPASVTFFGDDRDDNNWDNVFSYCYALRNIYVADDNPSFRSIDGVLFSKDGETLIAYPCNHAGEVYHVNAGTMCSSAFASCRNLRFLFLDNPETVWYTFTFDDTDLLTTFYLPGGFAEQRALGESQAGHCFVPADEIVELPEDLQRIETESFRDTAIRYVSVPDGCTRIEAGSFTGDALVFAQVGASTVIEDGAFESSVVIERR